MDEPISVSIRLEAFTQLLEAAGKVPVLTEQLSTLQRRLEGLQGQYSQLLEKVTELNRLI